MPEESSITIHLKKLPNNQCMVMIVNAVGEAFIHPIVISEPIDKIDLAVLSAIETPIKVASSLSTTLKAFEKSVEKAKEEGKEKTKTNSKKSKSAVKEAVKKEDEDTEDDEKIVEEEVQEDIPDLFPSTTIVETNPVVEKKEELKQETIKDPEKEVVKEFAPIQRGSEDINFMGNASVFDNAPDKLGAKPIEKPVIKEEPKKEKIVENNPIDPTKQEKKEEDPNEIKWF